MGLIPSIDISATFVRRGATILRCHLGPDHARDDRAAYRAWHPRRWHPRYSTLIAGISVTFMIYSTQSKTISVSMYEYLIGDEKLIA